jgi:glycosyltransferase involved in cell wall biosynthesis
VRVFFYGRAGNPRNAFGLGVAALVELKRRYGDAVEIVCAGESWNPGALGLADVLSNVGRLRNLDEVSELYRTCHVGLVLMVTKHPSYQPFEFMASGVACVSNRNPATDWFFRDGENCLLASPRPDAIARRIGELVDDPGLRAGIAESALAQVRRVRWEEQIERIWRVITKEAPGFERAPELAAGRTAP